MLRRNLAHTYSPGYFLAALGPGGLAVSFFMYLMFLVPHQGTPMTALQHWLPIVSAGGLSAVLIVLALSFFALLTTLHFTLLIWNFNTFRQYKTTPAYHQLRQSNAEVTLLTLPLTLAMSVNVLFIAGSLFVPHLWDIVQALLPFAALAFTLIGLWALTLYGRFISRLFAQGNFDHQNNNSFTQLIAPFTFAMIAVGLAAPGAMSHSVFVSGLSLALSSLFAALAVVLCVLWLLSGLKQISQQGFDKTAAPTLWILIPILTLLGITYVRQSMGVHHNFAATIENSHFLQVMSIIFGLQLLVGGFGYRIMQRLGYLREVVSGSHSGAAAFGLICPGVALVVFGFFFVNYALIANGVIDKYSLLHWVLLTPLLGVQLITGWMMLKLLKQQWWPASSVPQSR